jgi:hypothetical protein
MQLMMNPGMSVLRAEAGLRFPYLLLSAFIGVHRRFRRFDEMFSPHGE